MHGHGVFSVSLGFYRERIRHMRQLRNGEHGAIFAPRGITTEWSRRSRLIRECLREIPALSTIKTNGIKTLDRAQRLFDKRAFSYTAFLDATTLR